MKVQWQISRPMFRTFDIPGDAAAKEVAGAPRKFLFITRAQHAAILDRATIRYHFPAISNSINEPSLNLPKVHMSLFATWRGTLTIGPPSTVIDNHQATAIYLVSQNSRMPWWAPSRPRPLCLVPPNGAAGSDTNPRLRPTMPLSIRSETRRPRARSRV